MTAPDILATLVDGLRKNAKTLSQELARLKSDTSAHANMARKAAVAVAQEQFTTALNTFKTYMPVPWQQEKWSFTVAATGKSAKLACKAYTFEAVIPLADYDLAYTLGQFLGTCALANTAHTSTPNVQLNTNSKKDILYLLHAPAWHMVVRGISPYEALVRHTLKSFTVYAPSSFGRNEDVKVVFQRTYARSAEARHLHVSFIGALIEDIQEAPFFKKSTVTPGDINPLRKCFTNTAENWLSFFLNKREKFPHDKDREHAKFIATLDALTTSLMQVKGLVDQTKPRHGSTQKWLVEKNGKSAHHYAWDWRSALLVDALEDLTDATPSTPFDNQAVPYNAFTYGDKLALADE